MKKIIIGTMALIMAASVAACGSTESSSSDTKYGASVSDTSYSSTTANTTTKAVTTMTETDNLGVLTGSWAAVSGDTSLSANKKRKQLLTRRQKHSQVWNMNRSQFSALR